MDREEFICSLQELGINISEDKLNEQGQAILGPFFSLLESCESYEEFEQLLQNTTLKSKKFEQDLTKAIFLCELQGRADGLTQY